MPELEDLDDMEADLEDRIDDLDDEFDNDYADYD